MATWIALFRGINVGGNHLLPMKALAAALERDGFSGVRTYIQSGNVVFASPRGTASSLAARLGELVMRERGFQPQVFVLSVKDLTQAAARNPYPAADANPKALHLFFLAEKPRTPDVESLEKLATGRETFTLNGKVFYLYTPDGFGVSKLAARAERLLGVETTARNWRTVQTLVGMASGGAG